MRCTWGTRRMAYAVGGSHMTVHRVWWAFSSSCQWPELALILGMDIYPVAVGLRFSN
jgi:hypothetical protein